MPKKKFEHDIRYGARTDIGQVRDHNEDSLLVESPLFVVADGMGGHAAGEVASEIAIESMRKNAPKTADCDALANAVEIANQEIIKASIEGLGKEGMGTTMTAAVIESNKLCLAQVGDSRAYLLHNGRLQQITRDHSLMADLIEQGQITPAEARVHPNRSLITRALGNDPDMFADKYEIDIVEGDRILLCSDGLSSMLTDNIIEGFLNEIDDAQNCADKLVEQANVYGGLDNITVIVIDINGIVERNKMDQKKSKRVAIIVVVCVVLIFIAGITGGFLYVNNSAYLCEEDGYVTIYKGIPGEFAGVELSHKEYQSDILVDDLKESTQGHFHRGVIEVDNIDAAWKALDNYKEEAADKAANQNKSNVKKTKDRLNNQS